MPDMPSFEPAEISILQRSANFALLTVACIGCVFVSLYLFGLAINICKVIRDKRRFHKLLKEMSQEEQRSNSVRNLAYRTLLDLENSFNSETDWAKGHLVARNRLFEQEREAFESCLRQSLYRHVQTVRLK